MNTESPFQRIESTTNRLMTVVLNGLFFVIFIPFALIFIAGPAYGIYKRGFEAMLYPALIGWGLSFLILIPVIRYFMIKRKKPAQKIVVDETGLLFYNSASEIADQILYTDLRPSRQNFDIYTVNPVGSGIAPLLEITILSEKKEETTRRIDMNLPLKVVRNKSILYAHFLQGIVTFRPDLTIDPFVFRSYSIDTETWKVNSKGISPGGWLLFLATLVMTALICGFVFLLSETKN
ncbi:hypothetical protein J2786_000222 [Chryseobacterium vietnamense]|jgi:hypothetical protein|uniref:Uncharacterized protein n=1 Tax=Chryseobacterium vietnamense TaxID=866785 RepID=A0ACC6J276_9FLAO|nr:hypothetical protein [Chryseobacterium vietnamense]MDR6457129.1 hypothetical protein [Chryseobacterium vietnamense]